MVKNVFSNDEVNELQSGLSASSNDVRAIEAALLAKLVQPDSEMVLVRRRHLQDMGAIMREAAPFLETHPAARGPLSDELEGFGYMIDDILGKKKTGPRPS